MAQNRKAADLNEGSKRGEVSPILQKVATFMATLGEERR
jgi:hypothetical protein